jgi:hypothetical protein
MLVEVLIICFLILLCIQFNVFQTKIVEGAKNKKSTILKDVGKKMKDIGKPKSKPAPTVANDNAEDPGTDINANDSSLVSNDNADNGDDEQDGSSKTDQVFKPNSNPSEIAMDVHDLKNRYMALQSEVDSIHANMSSIASVNESLAKSSEPQSEITGNEIPVNVENASGPSNASTFLTSL